MNLKHVVWVLFFLTAGKASAWTESMEQSTQSWDKLVKANVDPTGGVDYQAFQDNRSALDSFVAAYKGFVFEGLTDAEKKSLYINLYNAVMIRHLLDYFAAKNIVVGSSEFLSTRINDIKIPGGNIWNGDYKVAVGKHKVTLDDLEHGLIRREGRSHLEALKVKVLDPRIHAAVNCAAVSCPPIRRAAYHPSNIDGLLTENMKRFLSADHQFKKLSDGKMQANSIVMWYYQDFDEHGQDVLKNDGAGDYLSTFIDKDSPDAVWKQNFLKKNFNDRSKISLRLSSSFDFQYDWRINDQKQVKAGHQKAK